MVKSPVSVGEDPPPLSPVVRIEVEDESEGERARRVSLASSLLGVETGGRAGEDEGEDMGRLSVVDEETDEEQPLRFDEPDAPDNVEVDQEGVLKAASFAKLIERLTASDTAGHDAARQTADLLLTYRAWTSPKRLMAALLQRLRSSQQPVVQLRALNVVRQWVDHHWRDFGREVGSLKAQLEALTEEAPKTCPSLVRPLQQLVTKVEQRLEQGEQEEEGEGEEEDDAGEGEEPLMGWDVFLLLEPKELAQQMTLRGTPPLRPPPPPHPLRVAPLGRHPPQRVCGLCAETAGPPRAAVDRAV